MTEHTIRTYVGSGFYVPGLVETRNVDWLVDTGCTVTLISDRVFRQIPEDNRPELLPPTKLLSSADGTRLKALGETVINITVGQKTVPHRSVIAEISNDGLLGMDFLKEHEFHIDFKRNQLSCGDESIEAYCREGRCQACRVAVAEHSVIPANSRTLITGRAAKPLAFGTWLMEPSKKSPGNQPILMARTLVQGRGRSLAVEVLNPTPEDVCLYKNTTLGVVVRLPQQEIVARLNVEEVADKKTWELPRKLDTEVQKILDNVSTELRPDEARKVERLLRRHSSVFSSKEEPFGRTDLVSHSIQTEVLKPIKQPVRRPPLHLRDEAAQEVQKMLQQGVIEPSDSPWAPLLYSSGRRTDH